MGRLIPEAMFERANFRTILITVVAVVLGFGVYVYGIWENPPGFYVDESGLAYNAYLLATTGAGEYGPSFPLYFRLYPEPFTQYSNPTQIYMLAALFLVTGPSILLARLLAAACVFAACLLLGWLGFKLSGNRMIGLIVAVTALLTPWLFEVGRLVLETFFYPLAVVLFLCALYRAQQKETWSPWNIAALSATLILLTYSYTIGRLFGGLMAAGLVLFIRSRRQVLNVLPVWIIYAISLVPLLIYARQNPDLTQRFYLISYVKPGMGVMEIIAQFIPRFVKELDPRDLLAVGDPNLRHHLPDSYGSILLGTFLLALISVAVIIIKRRTERWWWFVIFGLLASIVPGALTNDHVHTLRMIAYPVFLILLTVPALELLLSPTEVPASASKKKKRKTGEADVPVRSRPSQLQYAALGALMVLTLGQAAFFHWKYLTTGGQRDAGFDTGYKVLYDTAVARPQRPIYLVDSYWGPMSMHANWYAVLEGRDRNEFVRLDARSQPPPGAIVLSTELNCGNCELIRKEGIFLLYRAK
jgi:4-amino-4-deoxy-L-arabinose transferase-like glycosyltransferase